MQPALAGGLPQACGVGVNAARQSGCCRALAGLGCGTGHSQPGPGPCGCCCWLQEALGFTAKTISFNFTLKICLFHLSSQAVGRGSRGSAAAPCFRVGLRRSQRRCALRRFGGEAVWMLRCETSPEVSGLKLRVPWPWAGVCGAGRLCGHRARTQVGGEERSHRLHGPQGQPGLLFT